MQQGFWKKLKKPILALAPMANVTDASFRAIIAKYGKPDVMWTEFVSCDGLCSSGKEKILPDLKFSAKERPIVAQIFGATPKHFYETALLIQELGFDGIDINMGCPDRNVVRQKAGASLIKNPHLAQEIIRFTQRGAGKLPVSVKTRIGDTKNTIDEWMKYLLETEVAVITVHGRTRKEMSLVPAHWDAIGRAAELAKKFRSVERTLVLGNGDVTSIAEAKEKVKRYGVDGVMVGRGIFGNPWFFNVRTPKERVSFPKQMQVLLEHARLFEKMFSKQKSFDLMKKHFKAYVQGFAGAKELRIALMETKNAAEVADVLKKHADLIRSADDVTV